MMTALALGTTAINHIIYRDLWSLVYGKRQTANMNLCLVTKLSFSPYLSLTVLYLQKTRK